jgi:putative transport protein
MIDWFVGTLRTYPELAIFLSLAIGFSIGSRKLRNGMATVLLSS